MNEEEIVRVAQSPRQYADCMRCGQRIFRLVADPPYGEWFHLGEDDHPWRRCRTASWVQGKGYDETLNRRWTATPPTEE